MASIGYALSSEEHPATHLVRYARDAERAGFTFALISDHYHPWTNRQGESPFVWSTLGAIAQETERLQVGTGVTCPTIRTHPAIIAQAAATAAELMPGRFFLGLGSGEHLNEHILGDDWPPAPVRLELLEEAIEVIRALWTGDLTHHRGRYYVVEQARVYTLPDRLPPIVVGASGPVSTRLAARHGDGIIGVTPDARMIERYRRAGGAGPRIGQLKVCVAASEEEARRTAHEWWPVNGLQGLGADLRLPEDFEAATAIVRPEDSTPAFALGPDAGVHVAKIREYLDAGYDHVYVHQVGPDQQGFLDFYQREVLPELQDEPARVARLAA